MKKLLSLTLVLATVLATMFAITAPAMAAKNPTGVLKNGVPYATVETYPSNSSANKGIMKVSANKSSNNIMFNGEKVGTFYFDKNANTIDITITKDVSVDIEWHCSKYYAKASLDGVGKYGIPQLMQDNGKYQSFDQIWIVNVNKASVVVSYDRYLAYVKVWNDIYLDEATSSDVKAALYNHGGIAHYNALLAHYNADSLPPYWHFDSEMKAVYDYWADQLEPGLEYAGVNLKEIVERYGRVQ